MSKNFREYKGLRRRKQAKGQHQLAVAGRLTAIWSVSRPWLLCEPDKGNEKCHK